MTWMRAGVERRAVLRWAVGGAMLAAGAIVAMGGCTSGRQSERGAEAGFVYVTLVTGTGGGEKTAEEQQAIFRGHMSNIQRLAEEGKLLIAGPFSKPKDAAWRGLFVMNTRSVEEAKGWVETDPGVMERVFGVELIAMRSTAALRRAPEVERAMEKISAKPGEPPPNMRGYVIVRGGHWAELRRAAARATLGGGAMRARVILWGEFADRAGGVLVLDATDASAVETALREAGLKSDAQVCGWYSTKSLMDLGAGAGW